MNTSEKNNTNTTTHLQSESKKVSKIALHNPRGTERSEKTHNDIRARDIHQKIYLNEKLSITRGMVTASADVKQMLEPKGELCQKKICP